MTDLSSLPVPSHIAVIMDGNGRWAKSRHLPRAKGHEAGVKALKAFIKNAGDLGVKYLTFFAFSSENWDRPKDEVKTLMNLLRRYLRNEESSAKKENINYRFVGDLTKLDKDIVEQISHIEALTREKDGLFLNIALSYGAQDEIVHTAKALAEKVQAGTLAIEGITKEVFAAHLLTAPAPAPDLLIRTSGEKRISNFLLWQLAYAELVFTDTLWPDFGKDDLVSALNEYACRQRRFGKL